jgi:hypothetical protein
MEMVQGQLEATRRRFAALLGEEVEVDRPLRVICFSKKAEFAAYLLRLGHRLESLDGLYQPGSPGRVSVCAETEPSRPLEPERTVRVLLGYYFLEKYKGFLPRSWLNVGVANLIAKGSEGELGRLNRKLLAALARETVLNESELFGMGPWTLLRHLRKSADHHHFALMAQFNGQSWSVAEYLCGRGATEERREQFRGFLKDLKKRDRYEAVFERHFGHGFGRLLQDWRQWVLSNGPGIHEPPPDRIRKALLDWVIPFVRDPDAETRERILAVRDMGNAGFLLGADALIDLLRGNDPELRREAAWALEAISGRAGGEDVSAWEAWWNTLPDEVEPIQEHA